MTTTFLKREKGSNLAYVKTDGDKNQPMVVFLGGFKSDMQGTKALFLEQKCEETGQAFVRFDYAGHGESEGKFEDGTIGLWAKDALNVIDSQSDGRDLILVGSSMGGWIAFICALARKDKMAGLVGIAAAPDFTQEMYDNRFKDHHRAALEKDGFTHIPNDYSDEPYFITRALIEDGKAQSLLERGIDLDIPVRLVQGKLDEDVKWEHANAIKAAISGEDVKVILVEQGDHRLSKPEELDLIWQQVSDINAIYA